MITRIPEGKELYDMSNPQSLVDLQLKYSLHKQTTNVPILLTCNKILDVERLTEAFNLEIERNDSLRTKFVKVKGVRKQYFDDPFKYEPKYADFRGKTKLEQDKYINKQASIVLKIDKGNLFDFYIIHTADEKTALFFKASHFILDSAGVFVTFTDLLQIYLALENGTEMPKPLASFIPVLEEKLKYKPGTDAFKKDEEFFNNYILKDGEPFYAGIHGIKLLDDFRKKKKNPNIRYAKVFQILKDSSDVSTYKTSKRFTDKLTEYCTAARTSPQAVLLLGARTWVSKINRDAEDISVQTILNNRATVASKHTGGDLAESSFLRSIIKKDMTFEEASQTINSIQQQLYRHPNYSAVYCMKTVESKYFSELGGSYTSFMFSFLPITKPDLPEGWEISFESVSTGHFTTPLYMFVYTDVETGCLIFHSEFQTEYSTRADIDKLHDNMIKVIETGIAKPDITIGEILDTL